MNLAVPCVFLVLFIHVLYSDCLCAVFLHNNSLFPENVYLKCLCPLYQTQSYLTGNKTQISHIFTFSHFTDAFIQIYRYTYIKQKLQN